MIDREYAGSISSRKLILETAKFNVITAYSAGEAIETLRRFPLVEGAVVDAAIQDVPCAELVRGLREIRPDLPIIAICPGGTSSCAGATRELESFDPKELLGILQKLVPQATSEIEKREEDLVKGNE